MDDVACMIGYRPCPWMKWCWSFFTPLVCMVRARQAGLGRARWGASGQRLSPDSLHRASLSSMPCTPSHWSTTTPTCTRGGARPWAGALHSPPCCVCPSTCWAASSRPRGPWLRSVPRCHPSLLLGHDLMSKLPSFHPPDLAIESEASGSAWAGADWKESRPSGASACGRGRSSPGP